MTPISQSTDPGDLLDEAAAVLAYLDYTAPCLQNGGGQCGLDERAADGLSLILQAVSATIARARSLI